MDKKFSIKVVDLIFLTVIAVMVVLATSKELDAAAKARFQEAYGKLPLSFEANRGQADPQVKFLSRGSGYALFLTPTETVLVLRQGPGVESRLKTSPPDPQRPTFSVLRLKLTGASSNPKIVGLDELPGKVNYFVGNDPKKWRTDIPIYAKVKYEGVYPGIDLVYYGNQRQLEYDFIVTPGADPKSIKITFECERKRLPLRMDANGDLALEIDGGEIRLRKPLIYQEVDGERKGITGGFVIHKLKAQDLELTTYQIGFDVGDYDVSRPLIIDPVLGYSTYLGGSQPFEFDEGHSIAVDASGNAYVTGTTFNLRGLPLNFPTTSGAFDATPNGKKDVFVTKLNSTGSALVYSTYLGGNGDDEGWGIAVDSSGNAYVTGQTNSPDFPTAHPLSLPSGGLNAFVTKLNPSGSGLIYSTLLGGSSDDIGFAIALDSSGNAYVTGRTYSSDFPTVNSLPQDVTNGINRGVNGDAFVAKLGFTSALSLAYSTFLGGSGVDLGRGIAVDSSGNAYVTGSTTSSNFPTTVGAFDGTFNGGSSLNLGDVFVAKLNTAASGAAFLVYSTYLGGSRDDEGVSIDIDTSGNAYVTGRTSSHDFPTGAFQTTFGGGLFDAFVTKLNPSGSALIYSTYLGGSDDDEGHGIDVDAAGGVYIAGKTRSANFPTTADVFQPFFGGEGDAFVTKLNASGSGLIFSTYLGGTAEEFEFGIAVDSQGSVYVTGRTASTNFPTTRNALQKTLGSIFSINAFVAKVAFASDLSLVKRDSRDPITAGDDLTYTVTVTNNGPDVATGVKVTDTLPSGVTFVSATGSCSQSGGTLTCDIGTLARRASATITVIVRPKDGGTITNTASVTGVEADPNTSNNTAMETTRVIPAADLQVVKSDSPDPVNVGSDLTYTVVVTNNGPSTATGVTVTDTLPAGVTFISATPSSGSFTLVGSTLNWNIGTLASGASATITISVKPNFSGSIVNTAVVRGNETDPNAANNTATASTTVQGAGGAPAPRDAKQSVLSSLITLSSTVTDKQDLNKLEEAIKHLTRSLDPDFWRDSSLLQPKHGERVFNEEKNAVGKLVDLLRDRKSTISDSMLQGFIEQIVGIDRQLAKVAIAGVDPKDIAKANDELAKGDKDAAAGKYESAIEHYRNAWQHATRP